MLSEIFYWVLNISIIGGMTGLIVALVRKIPRLPRFAAYALWLVPLVRLWIPFGIASRWSLLTLISKYATKTVIIWEKAPGSPYSTMSNFAQAAESYFPVVYKTELLKSVFETASIIWAIVGTTAILTSVFLYALTKRELQDARHLEGDVWMSAKVSAPAVYGIIKPRIILPDWIPHSELPFILAHEQVHILRRDNLWRVVAVLTLCVHWFNPLCWFFLKWFFTDMELACDAKVLKTMGEDKAKDYASALLSCATGRSYFVSAFGGSNTRRRIESVLSYKRLTTLSTVAFGALIVAICFVLITNAVGG
ncbi:MAG TPA: peptidase M56 BlaR1 [Clostridiales bacterium UBA8960]|nr:peptidase M56 BlaR1 [Clostridiales bacterium UBA8960]